MSKKLRIASAISIAATLITTLFTTAGSGAAAQDLRSDPQLPVIEAPGSAPVTFHAQQTLPVEQALPQPETTESAPLGDETVPAAGPVATSLAALVEATPMPVALPDDLHCLAGAIYFEAKGETLAGQLAVGRVIIARARSGRFPASYCGVVYQPSQFSFVRGHAIPAVNKGSRDWADAVRIAMIADRGAWKSPIQSSFFHYLVFFLI